MQITGKKIFFGRKNVNSAKKNFFVYHQGFVSGTNYHDVIILHAPSCYCPMKTLLEMLVRTLQRVAVTKYWRARGVTVLGGDVDYLVQFGLLVALLRA